MTDDDIRAHVMKAEGVLDQTQDKVTGQFGEARKAIMAIDRACSQLLDSRDFYREARNELITDRDHWEHEAKRARANHKDTADRAIRLVRKLEKSLVEVQDLKAENEALRAGQGRWPDGDDSPVGDQVPRVITTEELRVGQLICIHRGHGWGVRAIGEFRELSDSKITLKTGGSGTFSESIKFHTIVLLEDAPTSDGPPAPRLTVHALNTAPVGSMVNEANRHWIKTTISGKWFRVTRFGQAERRTSEELLAAGYANATLTYPERGDHE